MHPARLSFLACKHAQPRAVVAKDVRPDGTFITLECGHTTTYVPHCDPRSIKSSNCRHCGEHYVRFAPQYAGEFTETV